MSATLTLILIVVFATVTAFAGWRGSRLPDFRKGPRLMPWRPIMLAGATVVFFLLVHLATLVGVRHDA